MGPTQSLILIIRVHTLPVRKAGLPARLPEGRAAFPRVQAQRGNCELSVLVSIPYSATSGAEIRYLPLCATQTSTARARCGKDIADKCFAVKTLLREPRKPMHLCLKDRANYAVLKQRSILCYLWNQCNITARRHQRQLSK